MPATGLCHRAQPSLKALGNIGIASSTYGIMGFSAAVDRTLLTASRKGRSIDVLQTLKTATLWLASGSEAAAALIIRLAAIEGIIRALALFVIRPSLRNPVALQPAIDSNIKFFLLVKNEIS